MSSPIATYDALHTLIVEKLSLEKFSEEKQGEIIDTLGGIIMKRLLLAAIDRIPLEHQEEFNRLSEGTEGITSQEVTAFIETHIPDWNNVMAQTISETIEEFKTKIGQ